MDPITKFHQKTRELLDKYAAGPIQIGDNLLRNYGKQIRAGTTGLGDLLTYQGMDKAGADTQRILDEDTSSLGERGQQTIHDAVIPAIKAVAGHEMLPSYFPGAPYDLGHIAKFAGDALQADDEGLSDLGSKVHPKLGAAIHAINQLAPNMITPEGAVMAGQAGRLAGKYLGREVAETAGKALPEKLAYTKSLMPTSEVQGLHPDHFTPPDHAMSYVASHPETGQHLGAVSFVKSGDGMRSLRMDTHPEYRGQGIAGDLLGDAIAHAHGQGMPYRSDTQVSVNAAKVYQKIPGMHYNEDVTHSIDPHDGDVGTSNNGHPVFKIDPAVAADDAQVGEHPQFDPNGHPMQGLAQQLAQQGGFTHSMQDGTQPTHGYAVAINKGTERSHDTLPSAQHLQAYADQHEDALSQPGNHFGAWSDPQSGKHFLDVSHIEPDFSTAVQKAKANAQLGIYDLGSGETVPTTDDQLHFIHYGNVDAPSMTLDPNKMGTGIKGREARRGGPKVTSVYAHDNAQPEPGLESKTPYRVTVPAKSMYDAGQDPLNLKSMASYNGNLDMSDYEQSIKDLGYHGYHVPDADGMMRGQGRLFNPTQATRIGPGAAAPAEEDLASGFAQGGPVRLAGGGEGGEIGSLLGGLGEMVAKYGIEKPSAIDSAAQTVTNAQRNAFPGIYNDPRQVIQDATAKVSPEDPLMQQLFGVSRGDLSDMALSRTGNEPGVLPGATAKPRGSAAAVGVMNPQNEQRLVDVLGEARKSPDLYHGMTGWYAMDPLYEHFKSTYGADAPAKYRQFNTLMGMASPGSDVGTEIARGSAANWLHTQGRFDDFERYGGGVENNASRDRPSDMADLPGHVYHRTAQAIPMRQYLDSGEMQMKSPKVPMYVHASGVPETGFQTDVPVGDAHWARGVGLADTRGERTLKGKPIIPGSSVSTPEMQTLAPWWRDRVAGQAGLQSVPAQAVAWGAFSPYTGVKSAIGAPKLEILSTQIGKLAQRLGVSPETARDLVVSGKAGAFKEGGSVE